MKGVDITPGAKGLGFKVAQVWVALVDHGSDDEGVPAGGFRTADGSVTLIVLMTANPARLPWLREAAQRIARDSGKRVRIACFRGREDLEVIEP